MDIIKDGTVVSIAYTLERTNGEIIEQRVESPITYVHGSNALLSNLEEALTGHKCGDNITVHFGETKVFGEKRDEQTIRYTKDVFADKMPLRVGTPIYTDRPAGPPDVWWVASIADETFEVSKSHPLAGDEVIFRVTVLAVRDATEQELLDGFVRK